ncbi:L,D-transpeptidase catalytic domain [Poseidonocella pacifica]|uniref:L,D-transpeptidase catalytic domain n=1 Tax=Poseidonocella pacifica TaxID=871651 RepID=A0A1I0YFE0_9RHOB|nr:L,D-transpeptidase family protein [Poseidonocella pacifica]SFB11527.1 L,D-transpeptidase catalytic domain [Poseidonocella pacifica]
MRILGWMLVVVIGLTLSGCATKFKTYDGPEVTRVVIFKNERKMYLFHHDKVLASHDVDLGFAPRGHKRIEGDGRTPEGRYLIDRRNPNSAFHLSIGISYPNEADVAAARAMGKSPGGDIFIHGTTPANRGKGRDWTAGCIAISDKEMEEVYAMVRDGTPVDIYP